MTINDVPIPSQGGGRQKENADDDDCGGGGVWIGIDLGTTNCTAAVWDSTRGHPKWMRLGRYQLAVPNSVSNKDGRIVPSAALFGRRRQLLTDDEQQQDDDDDHDQDFALFEPVDDIVSRNHNGNSTGLSACAGHAAKHHHQEQQPKHQDNGGNDGSEAEDEQRPHSSSQAMVTSVKRILSLQPEHVVEFTKDSSRSSRSNDDEGDDDDALKTQGGTSWIRSLPFDLVLTNDQHRDVDFQGEQRDHDTDTKTNGEAEDETSSPEREQPPERRVAIRVEPLSLSSSAGARCDDDADADANTTPPLLVYPVEVIAILLRSIRLAANAYLQKSATRKKNMRLPAAATSTKDGPLLECRHVVVGVPAHAGWALRRETMIQACRMAGFTGHVSTLTESTAAAMAYGLFVGGGGGSSGSGDTINKDDNDNDNNNAQGDDDEKNNNQVVEKEETSSSRSNKNTKTIFVFDMGGGTTDVTIAEMSKRGGGPMVMADNRDNDNDADAACDDVRVVLTDGDPVLGGDDVDAALARIVLEKMRVLVQQLEQKAEETITCTAMTTTPSLSSLSPPRRRSLLQQCRQAKEALCGQDDDAPAESAVVDVSTLCSGEGRAKKQNSCRIRLDGVDLKTALEPTLEKIRGLVRRALERYSDGYQKQQQRHEEQANNDRDRNSTSNTKDGDKNNDSDPNNLEKSSNNLAGTRTMDEVILIGGSSRIPAVRTCLREIFLELAAGGDGPQQEFCTSVHPMSAVAIGTAVQAAIRSNLVPMHELRSAMMLDTIPHAIGILVDDNYDDDQQQCHDGDNNGNITGADTNNNKKKKFVEILSRDATLPTMGYATFQLADINQAGVTLEVVEKVAGDNCSAFFTPLGTFTFLLHRLSKAQASRLLFSVQNSHESSPTTHTATPAIRRSVDIGITLTEHGELVVSIFDENDPEHVRKRDRYLQQQQQLGGQDDEQQHKSLTYFSHPARALKVATDEMTISPWEQTVLLVACGALLLLYIAVKVCFGEQMALLEHPQEDHHAVVDESTVTTTSDVADGTSTNVAAFAEL